MMPFEIFGPTLPMSEELHADKYRSAGESFREAMNRVASVLSDTDEEYHTFREIILAMRFLPGGRIQSAIGSTKIVTPYNCLSGDTRVVTAEYGLVQIAALSGRTAHVVNYEGEWTEAEFRSFGKQELYETRFTSGGRSLVVRSTGDHRWLSSEGEVVTGNLMAKIQKISKVDIPRSRSEGQQYLKGLAHGLVFGDGTRDGDGFFIRVCSSHLEICMVLEELGIPSSNPPSYSGDPVYYFYGSNAWTDLKATPENVSLQYLQGFFRGWLAADGCVSKQPEVLLTTDSIGLEYLERFGISVGFSPIEKSLLSSQTSYGYRSRPTYNVRLDRALLCREDLLLEKHKKRFEPTRRAWSITDNYKTGQEEQVYCAIVPDGQSFLLEKGLLTGNCFVSGRIEDNFTGKNGIMHQATKAAETMRMGGGIGYDFSTLRPRGSLIRSLHSHASGPVSFMAIYDACCRTIASAGHRRGAQMAVLRVDHPDIEEFIRSKQSHVRAPTLWEVVYSLSDDDPRKAKAIQDLQLTNELTGFNISVGITDEFMLAVENDQPFNLRWGGRTYKTIDARALWEQIMRATWDWAEPGVLFLDRVNRMNNLWYCEEIFATNPCGEQPLPAHGACLLGSFNLVKYLLPKKTRAKVKWEFDWDQFTTDIPRVVRAMDNVVDCARYPLKEQEKEAKSKRRMGLGVTGTANAGEALGHVYGSTRFLHFMSKVLETLFVEAYKASALLAKERGAFPKFDKDKYAKGHFITRLPAEVQEMIHKYGIRNSHLTSIAPTGTISLCADNISSGIEPVHSIRHERTVIEFLGPRKEVIEDYGYRILGVRGKISSECTADDHVNVLLAASRYVDSAVSKTCNVDPGMSWEDFKAIYVKAWEGGAKGCTTFNPGGKLLGVINESDDTETTCFIDPDTGARECG